MKESMASMPRSSRRSRTVIPMAMRLPSVYAECMKLKHAVTLAESQGSEVFRGYIGKLVAEGQGPGGSKASQRLSSDPTFRGLYGQTQQWLPGSLPKTRCRSLVIVRDQRVSHPESRIIIFATFRDTVQLLVDYLTVNGISCERFVGQATKDAEKGLSQKKQIAALTGSGKENLRSLLQPLSVKRALMFLPLTL